MIKKLEYTTIDRIKMFYLTSLSLIIFFVSYANGQSYVPESNNQKIVIKPKIKIKAYAFNLKDVRLLESPFKIAMKADVSYLLSLEPNRLLSAFRSHSGLKPRGEMYGGWESSGLAGHTLGHYLSACAMQYAATKDTVFLNRVNYVVNELDECQRARKTGYIGAIPKEDSVWNEVKMGNIKSQGFDLNGAWAPWYTVHKIMAGLLDAYLYCNNTKALAINVKLSDWTGATIANLDEALMQKMLICEYGGISETLENTYAITGNDKYLALSKRFYDKRILDSLAKQKDILQGRHSNTQIPKIIASARRYELTGSKKDSTIANYFWKTIVNNHSYVTGGNSNYEYLGKPNQLNNQLTDNTTETCNTYNMLKLTRHLFAEQPFATYMDYYEKALYNHILASQNHADGMMCYFTPLRMGGKKEFSDPLYSFTCCVGSGIENHVKYGESIYSKGADSSLFVNLFIPSVLSWDAMGLKLRQETSDPANSIISFSFDVKKPVSLTLRIRKPQWANNSVLKINGKGQATEVDEYGFFKVTRLWKQADHITISFNPEVYTEAMPDNNKRVGVFYGPVLLAGLLGTTEPDPVKGIPVLVTSEKNPNKWLTAINKEKLNFRTTHIAQPQEVDLMPFYQIADQHYTVYWDVFTPDGWKKQQKVYAQEKVEQEKLNARTIDIIRLGEMQPERDHNFKGDSIYTGEQHQRKFRTANVGGYMEFSMKVDRDKPNDLILTYWGMDNRGRIFDVVIDHIKVATVDLNKFKESKFYEIIYQLPQNLTQNKDIVRVKLVPKKGNQAGPIYGCRMVKSVTN